jgi:hypothetical protein
MGTVRPLASLGLPLVVAWVEGWTRANEVQPRPLASVLPEPLVGRLRTAGILGQLRRTVPAPGQAAWTLMLSLPAIAGVSVAWSSRADCRRS